MVIRGKAPNLQYLAGLFDGEGTIGLYRQVTTQEKAGYRYNIRVKFGMTFPEAPMWFQRNWGGSIRTYRNQLSTRDFHEWIVTDRNAENFLRSLGPHLRVKGRQVRLALRYRNLIGLNGTRVIQNMDARHALYLQMAKLNRPPAETKREGTQASVKR